MPRAGEEAPTTRRASRLAGRVEIVIFLESRRRSSRVQFTRLRPSGRCAIGQPASEALSGLIRPSSRSEGRGRRVGRFDAGRSRIVERREGLSTRTAV
ncbi:unnamed protein product [Vitrella brassicaformis CCMP3155]|uniref:Uncharacterized protein n=1 Tax=Vitrella brassicaformis (strain CCMP3155) TaxID=1169540 RepID=A0A0G4FQ54_VITBC|nr:unnamed protein product [Vitrella brassicaformis CCMP3155]|eukprot:CEM16568.1 unnamed protein product [Vitrella brassicaformis CCMP3155]